MKKELSRGSPAFAIQSIHNLIHKYLGPMLSKHNLGTCEDYEEMNENPPMSRSLSRESSQSQDPYAVLRAIKELIKEYLGE